MHGGDESTSPASPSIPPRADPRFRSAKGNKGGKSRGFPSRPFSQLSRVSKFSKLRGGSHCPCLASTYLLLPRPTSLRCIQRHDLLTSQFLSTQDPPSPHLQCKRRIRGFGQEFQSSQKPFSDSFHQQRGITGFFHHRRHLSSTPLPLRSLRFFSIPF